MMPIDLDTNPKACVNCGSNPALIRETEGVNIGDERFCSAECLVDRATEVAPWREPWPLRRLDIVRAADEELRRNRDR